MTTKAEAGQLGGLATAAKYGKKPHICAKYKRLCPLAVECPSEFHSNTGKKGAALGGSATAARHGREHFARIGSMGGRGRRKKEVVINETSIEAQNLSPEIPGHGG